MSGLPFIPPFCAWVAFSRVRRHGNPHQPLLAAGAGAEDIAHRKMEEGVYFPTPPGQPALPRMSRAAWNAWKVSIRCFATIVGIGMVACPFVWRYLYHDPQFQDPLKFIAVAILALGVMAAGYLTTLDQCIEM
ncbi:hypothetical protein ACP70R_038811 [Stipagrostis hirtigluma subsp. patula]